MSLEIGPAFSGKTLFVTGSSGFLGKVLLYRVVNEFPDVKRVYLLMRGKYARRLKKTFTAQERLEKEILGALCFAPLREALGEEKWRELCGRIVAVEGDIMADRLGLSAADYARLEAEVNYIVHLAATVNFNERLNLAVQMNTLGALRVLTLAHRCRRLEAMVHTSTCYVNWNRPGRHDPNEEVLYPLPFDPEAMCKHILSLHDYDVDYVTKHLLKEYNFSNTYTLTKSMGEHLVRKYQGDVPMVIVRPSIVGSAYRDPIPGWVDALTAAGGFVLTSGLGILREVHCKKHMIIDIVPVDYVVNTIIKALFKTQLYYKSQRGGGGGVGGRRPGTAAPRPQSQPNRLVADHLVPLGLGGEAAKKASGVLTQASLALQGGSGGGGGGGSGFHPSEPTARGAIGGPAGNDSSEGGGDLGAEGLPFVYQVATSSSLNHLTMDRMLRVTVPYWTRRHPKGLSKFDVVLTSSRLRFLTRLYTRRVLPYYAMKVLSKLPPPIGSKEKEATVARLGRALARVRDLNTQFNSFVMYEWVFSNANTAYLDDGLTQEDKARFASDPCDINWYVYLHLYSYGVLKYIVGDPADFPCPVLPPTPSTMFLRAKL